MRTFICRAIGRRPSAISHRIIAFAIVTALAASGWASMKQRARPQTVTPANVRMGSLLLRTDVDRGYIPAPTVETKVRIHVTGLIGRTRVVQTFRNPSNEWVEGVYVFPLPDVPSGLDVRGRRGEQPWGIGFQLRGGKTHSGVAKLWARRKIAAGMDSMDSMTEGADRDAVRVQVIDVALQHHLVSRFTSLVAVDVTPTAPHGSPMAKGMTKAVPTQLPAGWSYQHTVGTLPQGSTLAPLLALLGFLLLIVGLLIHWSGDKSCKDERSVYSSSP